MKKFIAPLLVTTLILGAGGLAFAQEETPLRDRVLKPLTNMMQEWKKETRKEHKEERKAEKDITITKENIENGIRITHKGNTEEAITELKKRAEQKPEPKEGEKLTHAIETTTDGFILTITSEDKEVVKKLQEEKKPGMHGKKGMPKMVGTMTQENIENGIKVTHTGSTEEEIKAIQEHAKNMKHPEDGKVTCTTELTPTGAIMTMTSTDPEMVKKLQEEKHMMQGKKHTMKEMKKHLQLGKVTREVIENGIRITHTGSTAEEIKAIQEHMDNMPEPKQEGVTVTKEVTETGVVLTFTSTDSEIVKKLQENKAQFHGEKGAKKKGMMKKMKHQEEKSSN